MNPLIERIAVGDEIADVLLRRHLLLQRVESRGVTVDPKNPEQNMLASEARKWRSTSTALTEARAVVTAREAAHPTMSPAALLALL